MANSNGNELHMEELKILGRSVDFGNNHDSESKVDGSNYDPKETLVEDLETDLQDQPHLLKLNREKSKLVFRNFLFLSLSFFIMYSAHGTINALLTNVFKNQGIGFASLAAVYGGKLMFIIPAPYIVRGLTPKWAAVLAYVLFMSIVFGGFTSNFYVMVISGLGTGFGTAIWFVAFGVMYANSASLYSTLTNEKESDVMPRFSGIFFTCINFAQALGSLISTTVLQNIQPKSTDEMYINNDLNGTVNITAYREIHENISLSISQTCGPHYCPFKEDEIDSVKNNGHKEYEKWIYILFSIFAFIEIIALLIAIFLVKNVDELYTSMPSIISQTTERPNILKSLKDKRLAVIFPLFFLRTQPFAMFTGHVTQAFITCGDRMSLVGFIVAWFAVCVAIFNFASGYVSKYVGQLYEMLFAFFLTISISLVWLLWEPKLGQDIFLFLLPIPSSCIFGIFQVQIHSLVAESFKETKVEAFTVLMLGESLGACFIFSFGHLLCFNIKVYIHLLITLFAAISYISFYLM